MDILETIRARVEKAGSQRALASEIQVSPQYLNDVLNGRKEPGEGILRPMGLERVVTYRKTRRPK